MPAMLRNLVVCVCMLATGLAADTLASGQVRLVDPFIGTGGHGHTYPGASVPFGMVQLSPDTRLTGWDGCSGYHYSDSLLYGFSHTHLSGTGIPDYCDILLMPTTGPVLLKRGSDESPESGYCSRFHHERESAEPGYYRVHLDDYGIDAEFTVSKRIGFHRYRYPAGEPGNLIVDLTHRDTVIDSYIRIVNDREIEGYRLSRAWAKEQHVYFVAHFSRPFIDYGIAVNGDAPKRSEKAFAQHITAFLSFDGTEREVLVKVGISAVDIEGARKNLEKEAPGWDFDAVRRSAGDEWERALGRIDIEGGDPDRRTIFYTALYHALLNPNLYMDVDGSYRGTDLGIHRAGDHTNYTVFSLWDTYRAAHPLFTILERERTTDFIKTFLAQYRQGGHLPVWELAANETWCMIGYHAVPVIVDAYVKGIRGFDAGLAFEAMKHSANLDHFGLEHYRRFGYISGNEEGESVSKTLEYAYDDWCIAQFARALGYEDDFKTFIERAQFYKNIFDPATGFMRAKHNGAWQEPFDATEVNFNLTEANTWQYTFYVPHDVETLIRLMGGRDRFVQKLDRLFSVSSATSGREQADITGMIGQYAHGNEPSHHMAYLYNFAGQPWKTQRRVRQILDSLYTAGPDGLCGNEDCGQMSAWYVLSALGFYPVTPGSDYYVIGTPLFKKAVITLENGNTFAIRAPHVSDKNIYIQSASLNGLPLTRSFLSHDEIMQGGDLVFGMGPNPNHHWGTGRDDIPRSAITDHLIQPVPFVAAGSRVFVDSTMVALSSILPSAAIHYTTDGTEPTLASPAYSEPVVIGEPATIKAFADLEGLPRSFTMEARFDKIHAGWSIQLNSEYAPQYAAGGDMALIDRIEGGDNFRTGTWQGYQGVDLEAVVSLGRTQTVHTITAGFLQEQNSWIFMPRDVEYAISLDGELFETVGTVTHDISPESDGSIALKFILDDLGRAARFVRVRARSIGACPEWHPGAGHPAWIFADEITVE
jgi:predicted alpha-1,2-mannosidase